LIFSCSAADTATARPGRTNAALPGIRNALNSAPDNRLHGEPIRPEPAASRRDNVDDSRAS